MKRDQVLKEFDEIFRTSKTEDEICKKLKDFGVKVAELELSIEALLIEKILVKDPVGAMRAKARIAAFARGYQSKVKALLKNFFA